MSKIVNFEKTKACSQSVLPDRSILIGQNYKIQMRHLVEFLNIVGHLGTPLVQVD